MTNEEYLAALERQNQERREKEARDAEKRKEVEDREKGFNLYNQGANAELGGQQQAQPKRR